MKNVFTNDEYRLLSIMIEKEFDRLQTAIRLNDCSERSEFKNIEEIRESLNTLQEIEKKING